MKKSDYTKLIDKKNDRTTTKRLLSYADAYDVLLRKKKIDKGGKA